MKMIKYTTGLATVLANKSFLLRTYKILAWLIAICSYKNANLFNIYLREHKSEAHFTVSFYIFKSKKVKGLWLHRSLDPLNIAGISMLPPPLLRILVCSSNRQISPNPSPFFLKYFCIRVCFASVLNCLRRSV